MGRKHAGDLDCPLWLTVCVSAVLTPVCCLLWSCDGWVLIHLSMVGPRQDPELMSCRAVAAHSFLIEEMLGSHLPD